jgi:hypothetical protein
MRIREAQILLAEFLRECRDEGARCVRVVHGKGLGSRGGPQMGSGSLAAPARGRHGLLHGPAERRGHGRGLRIAEDLRAPSSPPLRRERVGVNPCTPCPSVMIPVYGGQSIRGIRGRL